MTVLDTWPSRVEHQVVLAHALRDWVARGADVAAVPVRLLGPHPDDQLTHLADLLGLCGCYDGDELSEAGVHEHDRIWHLCLLPAGHAGVCPMIDNHEWLDMQRDSFIEQLDPVARVARRAAHAAGMKVGVFAYIEQR